MTKSKLYQIEANIKHNIKVNKQFNLRTLIKHKNIILKYLPEADYQLQLQTQQNELFEKLNQSYVFDPIQMLILFDCISEDIMKEKLTPKQYNKIVSWKQRNEDKFTKEGRAKIQQLGRKKYERKLSKQCPERSEIQI
jgi:hypothetical protein